jgi:hypothetical protein
MVSANSRKLNNAIELIDQDETIAPFMSSIITYGEKVALIVESE